MYSQKTESASLKRMLALVVRRNQLLRAAAYNFRWCSLLLVVRQIVLRRM